MDQRGEREENEKVVLNKNSRQAGEFILFYFLCILRYIFLVAGWQLRGISKEGQGQRRGQSIYNPINMD